MSTRSRAPNGRFSATNASTDPTGGGVEGTQEPDLSANTEPEPLSDPGAEPDSGDLAGQGGDGAGTDSESSTKITVLTRSTAWACSNSNCVGSYSVVL